MTLRICAPDIFSGDAVGNHCLGIARMAERMGIHAQLYALRYDLRMPGVQPLDALFSSVTADDTLLLSYSIFDPALERLLALDCKKVCYFHGVTDPQLLRDLEPQTADLCEMALAQLPLLARFDTVIANSRNTADGLTGVLDVAAVHVIPPVFADIDTFRRDLPSSVRTRREPNLLMVGRVVPHKRIEDGISILALLQQREFNATLTIVGKAPNYDYQKLLINHARRLGVLERVDFKGMLDDADLFECYETTSALLAMSQHEGFCVPVLEAMHFGKPVFVRGGTAAQELCPPNAVLAAEDDLAVWASAISSRLGHAANGKSVDPAFIAQANQVLERASDAIWQNVLSAPSKARSGGRPG